MNLVLEPTRMKPSGWARPRDESRTALWALSRPTEILLCLLLVASEVTCHHPQSPPRAESDEYAVYDAAIIWASAGDSSILRFVLRCRILYVVIQDQTAVETIFESPDVDSIIHQFGQGAVSAGIAEDFLGKNLTPSKLRPEFGGDYAYRLVPADELKFLFSREGAEDGWTQFYRRYRRSMGYLVLSRPGFNRDRNPALVHVGLNCGGLCGFGQYVLLEKEKGSWRVRETAQTWIS